jgi:hypothetical protein
MVGIRIIKGLQTLFLASNVEESPQTVVKCYTAIILIVGIIHQALV